MSADSSSRNEPTEESWIIPCPECRQSIAAPATMSGQLAECPFCTHHFVVEQPKAVSVAGAHDLGIAQQELANLEGQLKENATQITELRGNVSRLNMELHRHGLRMKILSERQAELQAGIAAAKTELGAQ